MHSFKNFALLPALLCLTSIVGATPISQSRQATSGSLQISSSSGLIEGFANSSAPSVRQFLGIPYVLPPTGSRRWLPPQNFTSTDTVVAHSIGPACPQQPLRNDWVYSVNGGNETEFFPEEIYSEDCLTLNIWAPSNPKSSAPLPVLVFFFGGRFVEGATNAHIYNPESWVQRTQEHIVVTVNFRMNILGFPNFKGLNDQNLGLLDQRAALLWLRQNIAAFGGDPSNMVKWGESAGAIACDFLNYAYPSDPIVTGMILDSGTALFPIDQSLSLDSAQSNYSSVAFTTGCSLAASPVDCMRSVPWQTLQGILLRDSTLRFQPVVDGRIIFENYTAQNSVGKVSSIPAIIGTNQHELSATVPQLPGLPVNPLLDRLSNSSFLCAAATSAKLRNGLDLTTYRYRYDGDFANISPPKYPGAFHASELPMIFGTAGQFHGASTTYQNTVSAKMQDLWLDFVKDPQKGLSKAGWDTYGNGKAVLLGRTDAVVKQIDVSGLDAGCQMSLDALAGS
nr:putative secreted lipase [Quercus suber]